MDFFCSERKRSIDKTVGTYVFQTSQSWCESRLEMMPGSSVAEQVTVNHLVVGSTPTRAATFSLKYLHEYLRLFCA